MYLQQTFQGCAVVHNELKLGKKCNLAEKCTELFLNRAAVPKRPTQWSDENFSQRLKSVFFFLKNHHSAGPFKIALLKFFFKKCCFFSLWGKQCFVPPNYTFFCALAHSVAHLKLSSKALYHCPSFDQYCIELKNWVLFKKREQRAATATTLNCI